MKTLFNLLINLLLFLVAPVIEWILMPINVVVVFAKDFRKRGFKNALIGISNYFKESAIRKDIYLCGEYRSLWNATLKTKEGKEIGINNRTLSADGRNDTETNQQPCLSLIQFQIDSGKLVISAYQRSSDASLGLPADLYHLYLISRQIHLPLKSISLTLGNVHIYENNIHATKRLLNGEKVSFELNV